MITDSYYIEFLNKKGTEDKFLGLKKGFAGFPILLYGERECSIME